MDRVAGLLVLQVVLQHGRQGLVAAQPPLQGGQRLALPGGAGLAGGARASITASSSSASSAATPASTRTWPPALGSPTSSCRRSTPGSGSTPAGALFAVDHARVVTDLGTPWGESPTCTSCGKCVQVCPTGALFEKGRSVAEGAKTRRPFLPYLKRPKEAPEP